MLILAMDFGGTKLAAGLVDRTTGDVLAATRCLTPNNATASYAAMLAMAQDLLAIAPSLPRAIGVSFGGPVEADGRTVRLSMHVPGWEYTALAASLERDIGLPCAIGNDADVAALAEQRYGAGRAASHLLYLTVSTGIGGGIVIDGAIYRGARAWAGEVGHQVLDPDGPPCSCGRNGCLEALASGLAVAREAKRRLALGDGRLELEPVPAAMRSAAPPTTPLYAPILGELPHEQITARAVAEAAAAGDPLAISVWTSAMHWLGIGIANAANLLNPTLVVLGGGLTGAGALLFDPVRQVLAHRALDPDLQVVPAALGEHIGLLGGTAIAP